MQLVGVRTVVEISDWIDICISRPATCEFASWQSIGREGVVCFIECLYISWVWEEVWKWSTIDGCRILGVRSERPDIVLVLIRCIYEYGTARYTSAAPCIAHWTRRSITCDKSIGNYCIAGDYHIRPTVSRFYYTKHVLSIGRESEGWTTNDRNCTTRETSRDRW